MSSRHLAASALSVLTTYWLSDSMKVASFLWFFLNLHYGYENNNSDGYLYIISHYLSGVLYTLWLTSVILSLLI